ncbi:MAG: hypothetical protein IJI35_04755, partial [Kiritimatiellae bacterium]|nr:hypothetical protein [Kiritimatiellia bacterium]
MGKELRVVFVSLAVFATACADELKIIEDGRSEYAIAVPSDDVAACMVREAADALQGYLFESTGCTLPIVNEAEIGVRPAFYLGRTQKGEAAQVPYAKLTDYVHCRKTVGRDIFLAGNDADG